MQDSKTTSIFPLTLFRIIAATSLLYFSLPFSESTVLPLAIFRANAQITQATQAEADRLSVQGNLYYEQNQFSEALDIWERSLIIYRELGDRRNEVVILNNIGYAQEARGEIQLAIDAYRESLNIAQTIFYYEGEYESLTNLGFIYYSSGQNQASLENYQQALAIAQENRDFWGEAFALENIGLIYGDLDEYQQAIESYQQALEGYQLVNDREGEAFIYLELGNISYDLGENTQAVEYGQQSLDLARELANIEQEMDALNLLILAYYELGDYEKVLDYDQQVSAIAGEIESFENDIGLYLQELNAARATEDYLAEIVALDNLSNTYYLSRQYAQVIEYGQQALILARNLENPEREASALNTLILAYYELENYDQVIEYSQHNLTLAQESSNLEELQFSLTFLWDAHLTLGDRTAAVNYGEQALAVARELEDQESERILLGGLSGSYGLLGDYSTSIEYYQQLLTVAIETEDRTREIEILNSLGLSYDALGNYAQVIDYHQQSLEIARAIGDREGEAEALSGLGGAYLNLDHQDRGIDYYQQALVITREVGDLDEEQNILSNLGSIYHDLGDSAKAIALLQEALYIAKETSDRIGEGTALGRLGIIYSDLSDYTLSINYYQQALAIFREESFTEGEPEVLNNLGLIYLDLEQYAQAIGYFEQGLAIARDRGLINLESYFISNIAIVFHNSGNLIEAEEKYYEAIQIRESIRSSLNNNDYLKILISDTSISSSLYQYLQDVLIDQAKHEEALEVSERSRNRALIDLLFESLNPEISQQISPELPTLPKIRQIAQERNQILVEYSISLNGRIYIWVISPNGDIAFRSVDLNSQTLAEAVELARVSVGSRNRSPAPDGTGQALGVEPAEPASEANINTHLQTLYQLLIEPIADLLPTDPETKVVFIPHGELFLVPFPALMDDKGTYLIEKHTILTAPSIQVLDLTRQQRQSAQAPGTSNTLVVGNPTMPSLYHPGLDKHDQLSPLPGAEQEATEIAQLLDIQPLLGDMATEADLKQHMTSAEIIHLATHGLLEYGDPQTFGVRDMPGAVALAPGNGEDGLLTSLEILDLNLNADLVVLSACDTGLGDITGDGVIGLSRSFVAAGVPSVIVSLWAVPDAPTAELMSHFYQNLQRGQDKAQALRQAMLMTMQTHPNPRNWAAFTLIGEAESRQFSASR